MNTVPPLESPRPISRRAILGASLAGGRALSVVSETVLPGQDQWIKFRSRYISSDGRVVDNGNGDISHSEGQGWGMLFAATFNDLDSFDHIYTWTKRTLRHKGSALHAWRFIPTAQPPVQDLNNATDGDLFIGAALARAGRRWGRAAYLRDAVEIARAILSLAVHQVGARVVLLPGVQGFERSGAVIVNPSYYAFPMITELAKLAPSPKWDRLQEDGHALIEHGRFGKWQLPPDWLRVAQSGRDLSPAPEWPPRFGFDAIRIPLWSTWQNAPQGALRRGLRQFWSAYPGDTMPAWVDLLSDAVSPYRATPGIVAVARLTQAVMNDTAPAIPVITSDTNYYDASLIMLSHLAWQERRMGGSL